MERQPRRFSRAKALAAGGLFLLADAACSSTPATPTPTRTPEATPSATPSLIVTPTPEVTPSPSLVVTPSPTPEATPSATPSLIVTPTPEVTPSPVITPTPEITPSPTPESTPVTMNGIVDSVVAEAEQNGGFENVSAQTLKQNFEEAYAADPEAASTTSHSGQTNSQIANLQWRYCSTGNNPEPGNPDYGRYLDCRFLVQNLWFAYGINNTADFLPAIEDAINFSENHLVQPYDQQLLEDLRSLQ